MGIVIIGIITMFLVVANFYLQSEIDELQAKLNRLTVLEETDSKQIELLSGFTVSISKKLEEIKTNEEVRKTIKNTNRSIVQKQKKQSKNNNKSEN